MLGTVVDFKNPDKALNRIDFEHWLCSNETALREDVGEWLPKEIETVERHNLLDGLIDETLNALDEAIGYDSSNADSNDHATDEREVESLETQEEEGEEAPGETPPLKTC